MRRQSVLAVDYALKNQGFTNILIAQDRSMFRGLLAEALGRAYPKAKIHSADCFADTIKFAQEHGPIDLFVLDPLLPGMDGDASVRQIRSAFPQASIVIMSMWEEHRVANRMIDAGANEFLGTGPPVNSMLEDLERIGASDLVTTISQHHGRHAPLPFQEPIQLTPRQIEILKYLQQQMQNKSIARNLDLSPHTVRNHIVVLMRLLGVNRRKQIAERAIELGLIAPSNDEQE